VVLSHEGKAQLETIILPLSFLELNHEKIKCYSFSDFGLIPLSVELFARHIDGLFLS
jgi:hypothetical protein